MATTTNEIREQQRETWNKFSAGWKKRDSFVSHWLQPVGEKLLELARLREDSVVLDAATGTGEPGLTAATRVKKGRVIGSDIAGDMIKIAVEKARIAGIKNYEGRVCDESSLPFPNDYFDAVVCRFGVMYFPDTFAGVRELGRVLKPGGTVALSAWAEPQKNPWGATAARIVNQMLALPPPAGDAPGVFRCATPGALSTLLQQTGLRSVKEVEVSGKVLFDSPQHYWEFITDVVAPVANALAKVDQAKREEVKRAVIEAVRPYADERSIVSLGWSSWVASGVK